MRFRLFDDETTLSDHPYLSTVVDAAKATSRGLKDAMTAERTDESMSPERWGPVDGPAPVEDTERSHIVEFDVYEGDTEDSTAKSARVQFWTPRDGGGIFAAWEIGDQSGGDAIFDRENDRLWFGTSAYWTDSGEPRASVAVSDPVGVELWDGFSSLMYSHQSRNVGIHSADAPEDGVRFEDNPARDRRPSGSILEVPVTGPRMTQPARLQPWCAENGGAVYVAWQVGTQEGRYGVLNAAGLWVGKDEQLTGPSGAIIPFIYIDSPEVEETLHEMIADVRERGGVPGEPLQCGEQCDTTTVSHPEAPGNQAPTTDEE